MGSWLLLSLGLSRWYDAFFVLFLLHGEDFTGLCEHHDDQFIGGRSEYDVINKANNPSN